jgi:hypothetical protein
MIQADKLQGKIDPPKTVVKAFQDLFDRTEPAPPDFNPDRARWEALKEKHSLTTPRVMTPDRID